MPTSAAALQQQCSCVYLLALLLVSSMHGHQFHVLAGGTSDPANKGAVVAASAAPIKPPGHSIVTNVQSSQLLFVLPTPDQYAVDGSGPSGEECKLRTELLSAMGAGGTPAGCSSSTTGSSSTSERAVSSSAVSDRGAISDSGFSSGSSSNSKSQTGKLSLSEYTQSSQSFRDGLFTNKVGQSFCISQEAAAAMVQQYHTHSVQPVFSTESSRALPDIEDPACEDAYAADSERTNCPQKPGAPSLHMHEDDTNADAVHSMSPDSTVESSSAHAVAPGGEPTAVGVATGTQEAAVNSADLDLVNCTRKFTQAGSQPRSLAIVLLRWGREYYLTKEQCCQAKNNAPGCDCTWGGRPYEALPPPKAFSRIFTDECDKGPSVNRGYYDLTGGRVTFHSKLRVPVPSRVGLSGDNGPGIIGGNSSVPGGPAGDDVIFPLPSPSPNAGPLEPIETPTSFMDPYGVDVYGWVTLDGMRNEKGQCRDWASEATRLAGVNATDYNHILYFQLLVSPALCDVCKEGACIGTCPAETGIITGCGCASCYVGWASQSGCSGPTPPGAKIALGVWPQMKFYEGDMADLVGGYGITVYEDMKRFLMHEAGHNMGLTHAGSIECKVAADGKTIMRDPQSCKPNWYGDRTSFMGSTSTQQLSAAMRYKVKWLPRKTLRVHRRGTAQRYTLRPATIRRASWQIGRRSGLRWFGDTEDLISIRIPLNGPVPTLSTSSYSCPCNPKGADNAPMCPACVEGACANGPCCTTEKCADDGLTWYYVELHMPFRNDYKSDYRGVAIRFMGELASTSCTSTRIVPTHVGQDGKLRYLLDKPDPTGETLGSRFEDGVRGVKVILNRWSNTSAVVYIKA